MSKIKVLQFKPPSSRTKDYLAAFGLREEVAPVFNRQGIYYDRHSKKCWVEVFGKAFEYRADYFLYCLNILNHRRLSNKELMALELLLKEKIISRQLQTKVTTEKQIRRTRESMVEVKKRFIAFRKERNEKNSSSRSANW